MSFRRNEGGDTLSPLPSFLPFAKDALKITQNSRSKLLCKGKAQNNIYIWVYDCQKDYILASHKRRRNYHPRGSPEWSPYPSWHHEFPFLTHVCHLNLSLFIKTSESVQSWGLHSSKHPHPTGSLSCIDSSGEIITCLPMNSLMVLLPITAQPAHFPVCRLPPCRPHCPSPETAGSTLFFLCCKFWWVHCSSQERNGVIFSVTSVIDTRQNPFLFYVSLELLLILTLRAIIPLLNFQDCSGFYSLQMT